MNNHTFIVPLLMNLLLIGCSPKGETQPDIEGFHSSFSADSSSIDSAFKQQLKAWNRGDIRGFMAYYHQSEQLQFITQKGRTTGWQNVLSNYQKSFPNQEKMGNLQFKTDYFQALSDSLMLSCGQWIVTRKEDERSGYFSLIWKKNDFNQWRIIVDHTW